MQYNISKKIQFCDMINWNWTYTFEILEKSVPINLISLNNNKELILLFNLNFSRDNLFISLVHFVSIWKILNETSYFVCVDPQQVPPPPALLAHPSPKSTSRIVSLLFVIPHKRFYFVVWITNTSFFSYLFIEGNLLSNQTSILEASASSSQSKQHPLPKSSLTSTKMTITSKQKTPPKSTLKQQLVPSTINAEHATPSEENIDLSQLPPDSEIFEDESEAEVIIFFLTELQFYSSNVFYWTIEIICLIRKMFLRVEKKLLKLLKHISNDKLSQLTTTHWYISNNSPFSIYYWDLFKLEILYLRRM